ncbi:MAG: PmoA family protein [Mariniphaga sp.]|nr:PmoA family protein [Mariniphaga sp.]
MKLWLVFAALFITTICFGQISMERQEEGILITEGNSNIFLYQIEPKSKEGLYSRNNYIHPLFGIDGYVLTEDFPADHLHHRGVFWAWHQIAIDGKRIGDGWELKDFIQEVSEIEFLINRQKYGILKTEVLWKSPVLKNKSPYLKENTSITVHPRQGKIRRIDFEIKLLALVQGLSIGGSEDAKGYGGFSARITLPDGIKFFGKKGIVQPETNAVEAGPYMNINGALANNGKQAGIVILCHSENPGYPQQWILREKESMQNVVFPGRDPVAISTIKPMVLKYTMLVYKGKLKSKKISKFLN